ncbi:hypothetical protein CesoFtcFv8_013095 [Champsocephalus esox]|uniref:Uncharacterized protein n=1 Tax=Champsocephalus esox TaxID=159716 RepID=A0AAN8BYP2_9TELE|nr:hypothetical protein CesoFtcFv8_013095 [Champsocephalus esox]
MLDESYSSLDSCYLTSPQIGPDRILPAPPHLANRTGSDPSCSSSPRCKSDRIPPAPPHLANRTGSDPSCSSSPHHRSDRTGSFLLLAKNRPLQFLFLTAGPDPPLTIGFNVQTDSKLREVAISPAFGRVVLCHESYVAVP